MSAELPSTEQIFTETSRLVPLLNQFASSTEMFVTAEASCKLEKHVKTEDKVTVVIKNTGLFISSM